MHAPEPHGSERHRVFGFLADPEGPRMGERIAVPRPRSGLRREWSDAGEEGGEQSEARPGVTAESGEALA